MVSIVFFKQTSCILYEYLTTGQCTFPKDMFWDNLYKFTYEHAGIS